MLDGKKIFPFPILTAKIFANEVMNQTGDSVKHFTDTNYMKLY